MIIDDDETDIVRRELTYTLRLRDDVKSDFTDEEKYQLRPIAETLAMLDGNAFFGATIDNGREWYEQYLPEAWSLWMSNGGETGWPAGTAWMAEAQLRKENPALASVWEQYQIMLKLTKETL
jgi:hypothetical protein